MESTEKKMTESTGENPKENLWQKFSLSLLEVIVIVIIIAMLARFLNSKPSQAERAKMVAAHGQIQSFEAPLEIFKEENGHYPSSLDDLVAKPSDATTNWTQHLDKIPADPWEHPYFYQCPGKHHP